MIVWIVELRSEHENMPYDDCVIMHVASSKVLAEAWIKQYPDACSDENWHWWIGCDPVDGDTAAWDHDWMTYYPDGRPRYEPDSTETAL